MIFRFKTLVSILLVALLWGLGACRITKEYRRPALGLPGSFGSGTADSITAADVPVREFFRDPTLLALIDSGLSHNNDLQAALQKLKAADIQARQARLDWLPALDIGVSAESSRPSDHSLNGLSATSLLHQHHIEDYNAYGTISWELDVWGKIRNTKSAALAGYLGTVEAARAIRTRLVTDIATGYYNLLMLDEQLRIAKRNLVLTDSTFQLTLLQQQAGQVTTLAVQQAEAQSQAIRQLLPQLDMQRRVQENALRLLTGRYPGAVDRGISLSGLPIRDSLAAGVPAEVLSRRPDVRQAELALVAANARVGVAKASLYPSLNITATGGLNSFKASNWFNVPASVFGLVAGSLAEPVFRHRQLKADWQVAEKNREAQVYDFRQSVLAAVGEVSDALVTIDRLKEVDTLASQRALTLQDAVTNAGLLFTSGMASYLEIITAQQQMLEAQLDLAEVRRQRLDAAVTLYRALGGGWK